MEQQSKNTEHIIVQPVLQIDYNTLVLLRCLPYKYATDFLKGDIYFGSVRKWIDLENSGNKGVGDALEGTFLSVLENDDSELVNKLKQNPQFQWFLYNGYLYFRRKKAENMLCLCLYGIHDKNYRVTTDELGGVHYTKEIPADYFSTFTDVKDRDEYNITDQSDRPAVIFINNPREFFDRIKNRLIELGCSASEIIISPVEYIDKKRTAITAVDFPKELLLKDQYFSDQSEVRVVLNVQNKQVLEYIQNHNSTISIGNISDIAEIYPYYFNSMYLEKRGKQILFTLPEPVEKPFEEMPFGELFEILLRIIQGNEICQGQLLAKNKELQQYCKCEMIKVIEQVHGVHIFMASPRDIQIIKTANTSESANDYFKKHTKENG